MSTIKLTCLFNGHNEMHTFSVTFPLELTIGHLLDCYENDHDTSDCKCQAAPTGVAWVANISPPILSRVQFDPAAATAARRCERDDLISSIVDDIEAFATVHLIVERTTRPRPDPTPPYFRDAQVGSATACKVGPFDQFCIWPAQESDFFGMSTTPGIVFVDKTSFVKPTRMCATKPHVVIRRPAGFGKSTFLSMIASHADILGGYPGGFGAADWADGTAHAIFEEGLGDPDNFSPRPRLIILTLDLARLDLSVHDDEETLHHRCTAFMEEEFCRDAKRYEHLLNPTGDSNLDNITSWWILFHQLRKVSLGLMVTIDNYTAPFVRLTTDRRALVERVTYSCFIKRLIKLIDCELLRCSYFVGRDLPPDEPLPWSTYDQFREMTEDLTESGSADAAFGFCASEIRALWRVAFPQLDGMPDPLGVVDPDSTEEDGRRYSICDVLRVLDDLRTCGADAERIAFQPQARAAFTNLRPQYTLQSSDLDPPILLAPLR